MIGRRKLAVGAAGLAALAIGVPLGLSQGGGTIDVFVGSTPTPTATPTATPTPTPTATPSPSTANLWVDGSGSCLRNATAAAYSNGDGHDCSSIQAALAAAAAGGDTIGLKGGTYGAQTLTTDKTSLTTVFLANGETATLGNLEMGANFVTIDKGSGTDLNFGSWNSETSVHDIALKGADVADVFLGGTGLTLSNITMQGGSVGPWESGGFASPFYVQLTTSTTGLVIDGVNFHDITTNPPTDHVEVIRIDGNASNVTIKNSRFVDNIDVDTSTIFITTVSDSSTQPHDITIENNLFGPNGSAPFATKVRDPNIVDCTNIVIQYNTFTGDTPWTHSSCSTFSGTVLRGNLGSQAPDDSCSAEGADHNVWGEIRTACGTDTVTSGSLGFDTDGYHILSSSIAKAAGSTTAPSRDYDGDTRPCGSSSADAGADEIC